jgi:homoserine dehydrogenase
MQIVQFGLGGVGRELAHQLMARRDALAARYGVRLDYRALADSRAALIGDRLDPQAVFAAVAAKSEGRSLADLPASRMLTDPGMLLQGKPGILVDVTASDAISSAMAGAVRAGWRVVLANKRPLSAGMGLFQRLTQAGATRYEATVGAGLPIISTLQSLIDGGDRIERIEATVSGTLAFLMSALEDGMPFSRALLEAKALGYTEPDPRDDLSGADVARKALILARTCGWLLTPEDPAPEALYPDALASVDPETFLGRLPELDAPMARRLADAKAAGAALRYVATVSAAGVQVGLQTLPSTHPLAGLRGADNLFSFTTSRYHERPLVIRGPGAGLSVTAAGVLADIVATAREFRD